MIFFSQLNACVCMCKNIIIIEKVSAAYNRDFIETFICMQYFTKTNKEDAYIFFNIFKNSGACISFPREYNKKKNL